MEGRYLIIFKKSYTLKLLISQQPSLILLQFEVSSKASGVGTGKSKGSSMSPVMSKSLVTTHTPRGVFCLSLSKSHY